MVGHQSLCSSTLNCLLRVGEDWLHARFFAPEYWDRLGELSNLAFPFPDSVENGGSASNTILPSSNSWKLTCDCHSFWE
jgi:hypothetical protein